MKSLADYGLNLDITTELELDGMHLHQLTMLLNDFADTLNNKHYIDNDEAPEITEDMPISLDELSDVESLGLIRWLCDRIELKLMETAK